MDKKELQVGGGGGVVYILLSWQGYDAFVQATTWCNPVARLRNRLRQGFSPAYFSDCPVFLGAISCGGFEMHAGKLRDKEAGRCRLQPGMLSAIVARVGAG